MKIGETLSNFSDMGNYKDAALVFVSFFTADAVMPNLTRKVGDMVDYDLNEKVPEVNGITVALVGYMMGTYEMVNKSTGNKVAMGGLISVLDHVTARFSVKSKVQNNSTGE